VRAGEKIEDSDLFGATDVIAGAGGSKAGVSSGCQRTMTLVVRTWVSMMRLRGTVLGLWASQVAWTETLKL
jgi:hypothetical protein